MAFDIEWLESAERELDAEIAYVLDEFGFEAARKAYLHLQKHVNHLAVWNNYKNPDSIDFRLLENNL